MFSLFVAVFWLRVFKCQQFKVFQTEHWLHLLRGAIKHSDWKDRTKWNTSLYWNDWKEAYDDYCDDPADDGDDCDDDVIVLKGELADRDDGGDDADCDDADEADDENVSRAELADRDQQQQEACSRCSYNTRTALRITNVIVIDHGDHDHQE